MKTRYRLIRRGTRGGMFYCVDTKTGKRASLQTANEDEARQLVESRNNADRQPAMNLQIAQVYLQHGDPALSARTWQNVMEQIIAVKSGETLLRWQAASQVSSLRGIGWCDQNDVEFFATGKSLKKGTSRTCPLLFNYGLFMAS
jgi:hypothetical protein